MRNRLAFRPFQTLRIVLVSVMVLTCLSCRVEKEMRLSGKTMGTTYHIRVLTGLFTSAEMLQERIDARLASINKSMSTYDPESEISRFNAIDSMTERFSPSEDFRRVLEVAAEIHRLTDGAWDGTIDPLINLWGFGRQGTANRIPEKTEIETALSAVGFDGIHFGPGGAIAKTNPALSLDLASIAKGYAVDEIARLLGRAGHTDFLVEIGGEVYARGYRKDDRPWRVGISRPDKAAPPDEVYRSVALVDKAMATSGDYRLFFQVGDQVFSHILDPRTGWPVRNGVVSASVIGENCTVADGLATALMVMGPERGVALVDRLPSVECLVVVRDFDGSLRDYPSRGFLLN